MNFKKLIIRLAVIPLAYVTVLGACGRDPAEIEPMDVASITGPRLKTEEKFFPGTNGFEFQPIDADAQARVQIEPGDVRIDKLTPRLDPDSIIHLPTLASYVYIDVALDVVDAGVAPDAADAGTAADEGGVACGGNCVNTQNDDSNCGGCGIVCGDAETCQSGSCTAGCNN